MWLLNLYIVFDFGEYFVNVSPGLGCRYSAVLQSTSDMALLVMSAFCEAQMSEYRCVSLRHTVNRDHTHFDSTHRQTKWDGLETIISGHTYWHIQKADWYWDKGIVPVLYNVSLTDCICGLLWLTTENHANYVFQRRNVKLVCFFKALKGIPLKKEWTINELWVMSCKFVILNWGHFTRWRIFWLLITDAIPVGGKGINHFFIKASICQHLTTKRDFWG